MTSSPSAGRDASLSTSEDAPPGIRAFNVPGRTGSDLSWLILLGVIWGSAFPVIRVGLLAGLSPLLLGAGRFALAAVIMVLLSLRSRGAWPSRNESLRLALLGGVVFVGGYAAFLNLGEQTISAGLSAVLVGTLPLWTALFGFLFLREDRLGVLGAGGVACGFVGLLVLFLPNVRTGFSTFTVGELWVVGAAVSAGLGTVLIRRFVPGSPGTRGLTIEFSAAAVMLAGLSLVPGVGASFPVTPTTVLVIVYLAVLPSGLGFAIYFELLQRIGPVGANLVSYVNPLAGVGIGVLFLGEGVTPSELAGFALVLVGLTLFQWQRTRAHARPRSSTRQDG